jgi:hypothetical protein
VQADAHDRLTLPASAPTLDCTEWGKDPGLDSGFNLILDRIQYTGVNDIMRLTSLMVMHDFLSRRLAPLQDQPACPAWMYTGVNDIMRQERGPRSSLDEVLLAACLKALTTDQFSVDLVVPAAVYEPICVNQAARTTLLATMPTLDDVDIALVQRGDQSCGMVIPKVGGLAGAAGGHSYGGGPAGGLGGVPTSGGPADDRGGVSAGNRGGGPIAATSKGKQARVVLDDDEVSSDEDEPLQKCLRWLSGAAGSSGSRPNPIAPHAAAATATTADQEAAEEAATATAADQEATD